MIEKYYTVKNQGSGEQIIQKSRFIAYVKRVESEKDAQEFIKEIKKKHYNATHNCSAYIIGVHDEIQKANDDGEPGGTAGVPILEVIKKKELKDTVIVVTRYFGGVKLGAGGLIRAYSSTASIGVEETGIIERKLVQIFLADIDYSLLGMLENEIKDSPYLINNLVYEDTVTLELFVDVSMTDQFHSWIINLTNNNIKLRPGEKKYIEVKI